MTLIIDGHTHTYPGAEKASYIISAFTNLHKMEPTFLGEGTVEDLLRLASENKINGAVLANFAPLPKLHENNLWTINSAKRHKYFIPLISLHPKMGCDLVEVMNSYLLLGAKGVKLHTGAQDFPPMSSELKSVYQFLDDEKIPVTFHCWKTSAVDTSQYSNLEMILPVVEKFSKIPFVFTHLGGGNPEEVFSLAENFPNIFFDTSITLTGRHCIKRIHDNFWEDDTFAVSAIREIGADRILFGSDYPYGSPYDDVKRFCRMKLSGSEKEKILGGNVLKLYGV